MLDSVNNRLLEFFANLYMVLTGQYTTTYQNESQAFTVYTVLFLGCIARFPVTNFSRTVRNNTMCG